MNERNNSSRTHFKNTPFFFILKRHFRIGKIIFEITLDKIRPL
ncbi:hypothetical protein LEP1GSC062_4023 [Leptospira alexanderi serovar Manhao 3 str. L 60]|uniref:Uncharacterized protein n=1 Tax=Leptospira alexanderi serovar Manhao 3 str. L 60 TaxID=1049759 RepID=V6I4F2_9LEPT|nr:hypothetical protein LEP1GSC062_4023 [Leptospira alexanderi serovar Manhao 3 str. L 60]